MAHVRTDETLTWPKVQQQLPNRTPRRLVTHLTACTSKALKEAALDVSLSCNFCMLTNHTAGRIVLSDVAKLLPLT